MSRNVRALAVALVVLLGVLLAWWSTRAPSAEGLSRAPLAPAVDPPREVVRTSAPTPTPAPAAATPTLAPDPQPAPVPSPSPMADEAPEVAAEWLEDVGRLLISAVDDEVDPELVEVSCESDGRRCVLEGPLITLDGHADLMGRIRQAIAEGTLAPADVSDLAFSRMAATRWEDGGPGFTLEIGLDPEEPPDPHGLR